MKTDSAEQGKTGEIANVKTLIFCRFCTTRHERGKLFCPARDNICEKCQLKNHFASCCQTSPKRIRMTVLGNDASENVKLEKSQSGQSSFKSVDSRMEPQVKVAKEGHEECSTKLTCLEGSGIAETKRTLDWTNDHLKTNYSSVSEIPDKDIISLMHSIIGWEYGFPQCPNAWLEVIWMMENENHDLSLNLLWKKNLEEIEKLLNWLKKKETENKSKDVPVSKTYENRFSLSRKEYNARFRHLIPLDCDVHLTPQQKKEKEEKYKARDPGRFWITLLIDNTK